MKILLTGFNCFRGVRWNPSEQVVRALAARQRSSRRAELVTAVLPTEYATATRLLRRLLRAERPDAVLCLGVAARRVALSLERVALNLDDDATPDNAGVIRRGRRIVMRGPDVYWSTLPLEALLDTLGRRRFQAVISNHAGAFLCNHVFYIARHEAARRRRAVPCGFLHLPGTGRGKPAQMRALRRMIRAVECCLEVIERELQSRERQQRRKPRRKG